MLDLLAAAHQATTEAAAHGAEHHEVATAFGVSILTPGFFVALAMIVVLLIMLKAGVPKLVAKALDQRIADIRQQLDEAARLRAEAEALRDEYAAKAKQAEADIAALRANAERQAEEIVAKAKDDATALIARHQTLSTEKIAAAERAAVEALRTKAADAAAVAAKQLIAESHGEAADRSLVDRTISAL